MEAPSPIWKLSRMARVQRQRSLEGPNSPEVTILPLNSSSDCLPACHSGRLTQKINFRPLKRGCFWIQFYEPEGWQRRQDGLQLYRIIIVISSFSIFLEHSLSLSLSSLHAQCKFANLKFLFRAIEILSFFPFPFFRIKYNTIQRRFKQLLKIASRK